MSKYLEFKELCNLRHKTKTFIVFNKSSEDDYLGFIKWKSTWRKYCFFPVEDTVFDSKCLMAIIRFMDKLNKKP